MPITPGQQFAWQPPQDSGQPARESCTMQAIISGAAGGVFGMLLGAVLAPFNSSLSNLETSELPLRQQMRIGMKEVGAQSRSWGKNLMVIGAVFSCSECFVEKTRGRTDRWNPIYGGCVTGGILAASGARRRRSTAWTCPLLAAHHTDSHPRPALTLMLGALFFHVPQPAHRRWPLDAPGLPPSPPPSTRWALVNLSE